jgi:hypothetical protein
MRDATRSSTAVLRHRAKKWRSIAVHRACFGFHCCKPVSDLDPRMHVPKIHCGIRAAAACCNVVLRVIGRTMRLQTNTLHVLQHSATAPCLSHACGHAERLSECPVRVLPAAACIPPREQLTRSSKKGTVRVALWEDRKACCRPGCVLNYA